MSPWRCNVGRHYDRWGDDDEPRRPRRAKQGGMSPVTIVLLVVGGVFLVGALGCGGLIWLGYQRTQEREREEAAAAEADRAERQRQMDMIGRAGGANADPF